MSGQTIQLVHTPVGVECSTDQEHAPTPGKFNFFFVISSILTYLLKLYTESKKLYIKANRYVKSTSN